MNGAIETSPQKRDLDTARGIVNDACVGVMTMIPSSFELVDRKKLEATLAQLIASQRAAEREALQLPPNGTAVPRASILELLDRVQHRADLRVDQCKFDVRRLKSKRSRDKLDRVLHFSSGVGVLKLELERMLAGLS